MIEGSTRIPQGRIQQGWFPVVGLTLALTSCCGTLALVAILGTLGIALRINEMFWGAAIGWLSIVRNTTRHGQIGPIFLGLGRPHDANASPFDRS